MGPPRPVRGAAEAEDLQYHPKVALRCQERELGAAEDDGRAAGKPLELLDRCGPSPRERRCLAGARTSSAVHSRRPRSTDFRLKSSIPRSTSAPVTSPAVAET